MKYYKPPPFLHMVKYDDTVQKILSSVSVFSSWFSFTEDPGIQVSEKYQALLKHSTRGRNMKYQAALSSHHAVGTSVWPDGGVSEHSVDSHLLVCAEDPPQGVLVLLGLFSLSRPPGSTGHHSEAFLWEVHDICTQNKQNTNFTVSEWKSNTINFNRRYIIKTTAWLGRQEDNKLSQNHLSSRRGLDASGRKNVCQQWWFMEVVCVVVCVRARVHSAYAGMGVKPKHSMTVCLHTNITQKKRPLVFNRM